MEKYGRNTQSTDDNIIWHKKGVICMLDDYVYVYFQLRTASF